MKQGRTILVLDNDPARHEVFRAAAAGFDVVETYHVLSFAQALQATEWLNLICLDHDLGGGANADCEYTMCGCDAVELVARSPLVGVPVLIHSSNSQCSQIMRRILVASGRVGRVARVNIATVMEHGERGGIEVVRGAIQELIASPHWPPAVSTRELLDMLGDDPRLVCPARKAQR